jgi:multicomponent K+:H+ antiporter subunit G
MNEVTDVPSLAAILTATLLIGGAAVTLIGSCGLLRFRSFYQRVHAPTLGTTLGTVFVTTASMIYFSALGTRPVLHELLVIVFVATTTPITLMVLVGAARFRDEAENERGLRGENNGSNSSLHRRHR